MQTSPCNFSGIFQELFKNFSGSARVAAIGLDHYNIRVPLDKLLEIRDFYCAALDLVEGARPAFGSTGYWLYAGAQPLVHLSGGTAEDCRSTTQTTVNHIAFACTDFDGMQAKLQRLGIASRFKAIPSEQVQRQPQRQLFLTDPGGNGIELNFAAEL
jgi:extradiol dioxygenase family protein